jgi:hypothetical protein
MSARDFRPGVPEPLPLSRLQYWGAILWPSFFAASVCTTVLFALVDPLELEGLAGFGASIGREWSYTVGFFAFWVATAGSSCFTTVLLRPAIAIERSPR